MKKLLTVLLSTILVFTLCTPVFAATSFPSDINRWSEKDWKNWEKYLSDIYGDDWMDFYYGENNEHHVVGKDDPVFWGNQGQGQRPPEDQQRFEAEKRRREIEEWEKYKKELEQYEKDLKKYEKEMKQYEKDMAQYNQQMYNYYASGGNNTSYGNYSYNNYSGYNYYGGIINATDSSTEDQAVALAKIIYLYSGGISQISRQAAVGWAVMNAIDMSGNVSVLTVAPNFHYDASLPTVDNFGRDLVPLARDIIFRWKAGKAGVTNNGRILPAGYMYLWSTGGTSLVVRNTPSEAGTPWNWSYTSPYGS